MCSFSHRMSWFWIAMAAVVFGGCSQPIEEVGGVDGARAIAVGNSQADEPVCEVTIEHQSKVDIFWSSAEKDLNELPDIIIDESVEIYSDWNKLFPLLAAGGASIAMHNSDADQRIDKELQDNAFLGKTGDEIVFNLGGPGAHFGAAGVWYALSAANRDELNKDRAWTMLKALSVTGTSTMALKLLRNNETPNDKALAWPSGHTSSSFTVAAVLDEFYGPEVGIPAYLGAGFVGYRMMESGDHWASDVLFGATLGYIVGHHVAGKDKKLEVGGFDVIPLMGVLDDDSNRTMTGIGFVRQF